MHAKRHVRRRVEHYNLFFSLDLHGEDQNRLASRIDFEEEVSSIDTSARVVLDVLMDLCHSLHEDNIEFMFT